jgi:hypothetical protein
MKIQMLQLCFTFGEAQRAWLGCDPERRTPALAHYEEIITSYRAQILQLLGKSLLKIADQDMTCETAKPSLDYNVAMAEATYFNSWLSARSFDAQSTI